MEAKVTIVFNRRKNATLKSDDKPVRASVEIQTTVDGKRSWKSTGVAVFLDQWRDGLVVNHVDAAECNLRIRRLFEDTVILYRERGANGVSAAELTGNGNRSFLDWMELQISDRTDIAPSTKRAHERTMEYLREAGYIVRFRDLTERNVTLWDLWLKRRLREQSAVHGYHKRLKVYIARAIHLGLLEDTPYRFVKVPKGRKEAIKYLTPAERDRIEALELSGSDEVVRDMFVVACYTGLAYCDLVRVKELVVAEDGVMYIDGSRLKTSTKFRLRILPKALRILEKYGFDLDLMSNQKCNAHLKVIAARAGVDKNLTMHMGRHTFATWALKKGVALPVVSKMLAHTNIVTTQIYAKVLQEDVESGFDKLNC